MKITELIADLKALSASCEYCDIKEYDDSWNKIKTLCLGDNYYTVLSMFYDCKDKKFGIMAEGEDRVEIKISYCPMCGRKLS